MSDGSEAKIFVGNLPFATSEDTLREYFAQFGNILDVKIITDRETGKSRGFGFITFDSAECAMEAIDKMNGAELEARKLTVNKASSRSGGGGRGGRSGGYGGGGVRGYQGGYMYGGGGGGWAQGYQ